MSLNQLASEIHDLTSSKGFWPEGRPLPEALLLVISEVVEAMEEYRNGEEANSTYYEGDKPLGIPTELADVIIRTLDICAAYGIDIDKAVAEKMRYNRQRPHRHGKKF